MRVEVGALQCFDLGSALTPVRGGHGEVRIEQVRGESVTREVRATAPLKLFVPSNNGRSAWVYSSSLGGGLLGGDDLHLGVSVGAESMAFLTTQASTKVYRSEKPCRSALTANVADDALLVSWPEPTVCFEGSDFSQEQRFSLAPTASLVMVDALCAGRVKNGERWAFRRYASRVRVERGGQPYLDDRLLLDPRHGSFKARLGDADILVLLVLCGPRVTQHAKELVGEIGARPLGEWIAASPLPPGADDVADGAVVRIAARSLEVAWAMLRERLAFLGEIIGDDPWSRKW